MSFTENLYLKRMIQQLHEENLKLKSFINEALRDPRKETTRPFFGPGSQPHEPGQDVGPGYPSLRDPRKETMRPFFGPGSSDLHPTNPLRVDDADTGSAPHPGEEGAVDDMPTNPFPVGGTSTPRLDSHGKVIPEKPYLLTHDDIPQNAPKRRYPLQRRSRHGYF